MDNLDHCPFCGEQPKTGFWVSQHSYEEEIVCFSVTCTGCGVSKTKKVKFGRDGATFADIQKAMNEAIKLWNHRV
jgi:C4-type Zn-finger protein